MSESTEYKGTARVMCRCGECCEVTLEEWTEAALVEEEAHLAAEEEHGWGSHGFCPDCEAELAADRAADGAERRSREAA